MELLKLVFLTSSQCELSISFRQRTNTYTDPSPDQVIRLDATAIVAALSGFLKVWPLGQ